MNPENIAKNKIVIYEIPPNHLNMFYSNGKARYCGDCGSAFVVEPPMYVWRCPYCNNILRSKPRNKKKGDRNEEV